MKKYVLILAVFALLIISACSNENIAGDAKKSLIISEPTTKDNNGTGNNTPYCWDSDGDNKFTTGYVNTDNETFDDFCNDNETLFEGICNNTMLVLKEYWCENGCNWTHCLTYTNSTINISITKKEVEGVYTE